MQIEFLALRHQHSICGPVTLPETVTRLCVTDSIVSSGKDSDEKLAAISALGVEAEVERSTFFGTVAVRSVNDLGYWVAFTFY